MYVYLFGWIRRFYSSCIDMFVPDIHVLIDGTIWSGRIGRSIDSIDR